VPPTNELLLLGEKFRFDKCCLADTCSIVLAVRVGVRKVRPSGIALNSA
jgi:hypothetical protein